jgi:uncharacterized protein
MDYFQYQFEIKALSDVGQIEGLAAGYGNVDYGGDIVAPGAFVESLAAHKAAGTMPLMLMHHDQHRPAGRWDSFAESSDGLIAKGKLTLGATDGREAYALLKDRALTGLSIGFRPTDVDRSSSGARVIKKADLAEVSLVSFPMNTRARVMSVKSLGSIRDLESLLAEAGMSSRKAKIAAAAAWRAVDGKSDDDPDEVKLAGILETANAGLARYLETK